MGGPGNASYFGEWLSEPTTMAPIMKALEDANGPMLVRDVVRETGIARHLVNKALARLHSRGYVDRYKIDERRIGPSGHPVTFSVWCYQYIVGNDE